MSVGWFSLHKYPPERKCPSQSRRKETMTFGKRLREYLKQGHTIPLITCSNCGGSYGTLVKTGDTYTHMRPVDCELHRRVEAKKANIMVQAKPNE